MLAWMRLVSRVRFVDEEKMSPVQLALETARFEFSHLHGSTISWPGSSSYTYIFDSTEPNRRIDVALQSLGLMDTRADSHTPSE